MITPLPHDAWMRAGQYFMRGMLGAALHQGELCRALIGAAIEDLERLSRLRAPDEVIRTEMIIAGQQTRRLAEALGTLADEWRDCCLTSMAVALDRPTEPA